MKKFTLFLSAMLISLMSFAQTVPTNEELLLTFKQDYLAHFNITDATDTDLNVREAGNFIYVMNSKGGDAVKFITENANWKWLADYIISVAAAIPEGTNEGYYWRANLDAFFHCKNAVAVGGVNSADFTEAGKPEAWGPAYLAAQESTTPELTTVTLTYELTKDAVDNRMGRQTISTEDAEFGGIQLIIPGFSEDVAEYAEASLAVGDSTYAATATFAADAENNKEVYTAHAVSADTIFDATFTILIPATQEYTLTTVDAVAVPETEDGLTMYALEGEFVVEDALIPYELYAEPTFLTVMGTIGEAYVVGEGAEKVTFEIDEEEFYLKATLADDAGNTYNVDPFGAGADPHPL